MILRRRRSSLSRRPATPAPRLTRRLTGTARGIRGVRHAGSPTDASSTEAASEREVDSLLGEGTPGTSEDPAAVIPGPPLNWHTPFLIGLLGLLGAAVGYGIVLMLVKVATILLYVVVALFLALGLEPIVARLVRAGLSRTWSVLMVLLGAAAVCALIGWLIIPTIVDQITTLVQATPGYVDDVQHTKWVQQLDHRWHISDRLLQDAKTSINQKTVTSALGGVLGAGKAFAEGLVAVFTVFVLTVYFVAAMPSVKSAAYKLVPQSRRPRVVFLSEEISQRVGRYLIAQTGVAVINGMFSYVILRVLGLPFPAVLAVLIGLLALIPIVGTLVGGTIITLVALSNGWLSAVIVLAYYVGYHAFEAYVLGPRIMRRVVEVPPAITIVAVLAGGTLLGIVGALIAIPVAAGLLLLYHQVAVPRQQQS